MKYFFLLTLFTLVGCQSKQESITPVIQPITESVYASGIIVSKNQYQVFATVSGIVNHVFVDEGAIVQIGTPLVSIGNEAQKLMADNAKLSYEFNALYINRSKLNESKLFVDLSKSKMENDSIMLERQKVLWADKIGSQVELEQKELAYQNSKANYASAKEKHKELEKQLNFLAKQAQNNLLISTKNTSDYVVKSQLNGRVYQLNIAEGEIVTPQIPLAIVGDDEKYILEMQVDEYDIVAIKLRMQVLVILNSYENAVFKATVTKINPIMNLQSKTFTVEAEFTQQPSVLYPNTSFEANILIRTKKDALLIPRNYLLNDTIVVSKSGKQIIVKTGLKDFKMVEILSGLDAKEELILPQK